MIMSVLTALPSSAFAANAYDKITGVSVYIDGHIDPGKKPTLIKALAENYPDEYNLFTVSYSGGNIVMGSSVLFQTPGGESVSTGASATAATYVLDFTMNIFDANNVPRTFDSASKIDVYINGSHAYGNGLPYTGNVTTFYSNSHDNAGLRIKQKFGNVKLTTPSSVTSLGFYNGSYQVPIEAPAVDGKHFAGWTGKDGNSQKAVFADATKAKTTVKAIAEGLSVTPNYEAHTPVAVAAVPATFKAAGKTAGTRCSACNAVLTAQKNVAKLGSPKLSKVTKAKKAFTAKWKKIANIDGYEVQYSLNKSFKKAKKYKTTTKKAKNTATSLKVSKLKSKKTYYVRIRAYKTINGKKQYSAWSAKKTVKTK